MKGDKLQPKQALFVKEYLKDLNASAAYLRAGYKTKNASVMASQLMANPKIKALIKEAMDERSVRTGITQDDVLKFWKRRMDFNPKDLYAEDGSLKPITELPDEVAQCLTGLEAIQLAGSEDAAVVLKKVKWVDGEAAAANAAKHLGMLKDRVEHSGKVTLESLLEGTAE